MPETYNWSWIESQTADAIGVWNRCASQAPSAGPEYTPEEQRRREKAYDKELDAVEREAKRKPKTRAERLEVQERTTAAFARFSAAALDLQGDAIQLLTDDFLPVGTRLARWGRRFDERLSMADIVQACRNAWTACGLQTLFDTRLELTPSILGYSLLYPYTDNFLDRLDISADQKRGFSARFGERLRGESIAAQNAHERALWALVELIEGQYPRECYPQVFDCLLDIHRAQEESVVQLEGTGVSADVLGISCRKGGSSVLADACLARGCLTPQESRFAFQWGVLLQLGDDLQDVREDLQRGSVTLFSRAAAHGVPLDALATQLLSFSDTVAVFMDHLPSGSPMLKELLRMSWRSLIVGAIADSHRHFTPEFLQHIEGSSPFRFEFLRARRKRITARRGLFVSLFDAFLDGPEDDDCALPMPAPVFASV